MLDCHSRYGRYSRYGARVEAITAAESSTKVTAYLSAESPIGPYLGNGLIGGTP